MSTKPLGSAALVALLLAGTLIACGSSSSSPANGMIFYGDNGNQVWTLNPNGGGRHRLLHFGADPGISPDGTRVAYVAGVVDRSSDQFVPRLWVMKADGGGKRQLPIHLAASDAGAHPDWSPDGATIIFSGSQDPGEFDHIYSVGADGSALKQLTRGADSSPTWSPDGKKIAFVRFNEASPTFELFVMNADGSDQHKVTAGVAMDPDWSPDGERIAFDGPGGINVINPDGSGRHTLVRRAGQPAWSPDGKQIAYQFGELGEPTNGVYAMNVDGTGKRQLTHLAFGSVDSLSWQPRR
jgi:TolB protein